MIDHKAATAALRHWMPLLAPALVLALPLVLLAAAGVVMVWQHALFLPWMFLLLFSGWLAHRLFLRARSRYDRDLPRQEADPKWQGRASEAWTLVEDRAASISQDDWSTELNDHLIRAREVMADVARHCHPKASDPLLEVTLPHALQVLELASHDLRHDVINAVPFGHRLTIADIGRGQQLASLAGRLSELYRLGQLFINPGSAVAQQLRASLTGQTLDATGNAIKLWLMREWVRKVGFHAINLYSGQVLLKAPRHDRPSAADEARATQAAIAAEPLRLLLIGRAGVGKSSLINAMFGRPMAPTRQSGDSTDGMTAFALEHDGISEAMVLDTPACDSPDFPRKALQREVKQTDAILLLVSALRADRAPEKALLEDLRDTADKRGQSLPPLLVVLSFCDKLPPPRDWNPPYDLSAKAQPKARAMAAAMAAVSQELDVPLERVIPVCLAAGREYNVADTLIGSLGDAMGEISQARLRRCHAAYRSAERRGMLKDQLLAAGRLLRRSLS